MHSNSNKNTLQLLTVEQTSKILALKDNRLVLMLIKTGELPGVRLSARQYRVKQKDLDQYIESKRYQVHTL